MLEKKSYGKINLSLEVVSKRADGYHEIDTLMTRINLFDEITFEKLDSNDIIIISDKKDFPTDKSNLIYKAWNILRAYKEDDFGIKVTVNKNIPIAAGLAGGTSNGVETIKALNELWDLNFTNDELKILAKPLGADSSFFFYDGLVRARGIGEKINILPFSHNLPLLLINIGKGVSSKEVYENMKVFSNGKVQNLVNNIDNFNFMKNNIFNSMEAVTFFFYPELELVKKKLRENGAEFSLMSGSGPTIFAVFSDIKKRDWAYEKMKNDYSYVIKTETI